MGNCGTSHAVILYCTCWISLLRYNQSSTEAANNMAAVSPQSPGPGDTLVAAALKVLRQSEASLKASWTMQAADLWRRGEISVVACGSDPAPPDTPARGGEVSACRSSVLQ